LRGSEHNNAGNDLYNQNDNDNQNVDACSHNNPEDDTAPDQLVLDVTEEVEEDMQGRHFPVSRKLGSFTILMQKGWAFLFVLAVHAYQV